MVVDESKLAATDAGPNALFGRSASIDGDTALIGAVGAAYVHVRSGTLWTEQAKLTPSDAGGSFGYAVAIHGDTAIVGSPAARAAYIFVRTGSIWSEEAKLSTIDTVATQFGSFVALDSDTAIIGAVTGLAIVPSAAYVFRRTGTLWSQEQKLTPTDMADGQAFGSALAIQGELALIGALGDNEAGQQAGAVYEFIRSGQTWTQQQKFVAMDAASHDHFGTSLAMSGGTAIVGSAQDSENGFASGSAYVFSRGGSGWTQQQKLTASDAAVDQRFGMSVGVDGDKAVVAALLYNQPGEVVGASTDTYAYLFARDEAVWHETEKLITGSGSSVLTEADFADISGCGVVVGTELDDDHGKDSGSAFAYLVAGCPCSDPLEGLVSWWTLDQLTSPARDSSDSNDGMWINDPVPSAGIVDGALRFDGTQHVEVANDSSLNFGVSQGFTIDAWVRPLKPMKFGSIVDKRDPANGRGYSLRIEEGRIAFIVSDGSSASVSFLGTDVLPIDRWTFVAVTVDRVADSGSVYVNGNLSGGFIPSDTAAGTSENDAPLLIATSSEALDTYLGLIDELEIFARPLNAGEIALIYGSLSGGKCKPCITPPAGIVAWWPFDETSGSVSNDVVGPNSGSQIGGPVPANGKVDTALEFAKESQRVEVLDHPSLDLGAESNLSIDVWIRPVELENRISTIVEKLDRFTRVGYRLFLRSGRLIFGMSDGSVPQFSYISPVTIPTESWSFLAITVDRDLDEGRVFMNGLLEGTFTPSMTAPSSISNSALLFIGGNPEGDDFRGRIDELELYKRALTPSEINDLFIAGTSGKCRPPEGGDARSGHNG